MWRNFLMASLRQVGRYKVFTLINLLGLAVGMACCILMGLYVIDALSYDRFHANAGRIVRVCDGDNARMPSLWGPVIQQDFPQVQAMVRLHHVFYMDPLLSYKDVHLFQDRMVFADASFFNVFDFEVVLGDQQTMLKDPFTLVLTQTLARQFFGSENPLGKTLSMNAQQELVVTGVVKDPPAQSHIHFDCLVSYPTFLALEEVWGNPINWRNHNDFTYLLLAENVDIADLEAQLGPWKTKYVSADLAARHDFRLQPILDIHLKSQLRNEMEPGSSMSLVLILSSIALCVLMIAAINFVNLSTARSMVRAREVAIRKVIGADRGHLLIQFLFESLISSLLALLLALMLIELTLPIFNGLTGKQIQLAYFDGRFLLPAFLGLALLVGLGAGLFPAIVLSGFQPLSGLKGGLSTGGRGTVFLRRSLVVMQFGISITLMVVTGFVFRQLHFMQNKDLGFNPNPLISLALNPGMSKDDLLLLHQELGQLPAVVSRTFSHRIPGEQMNAFRVVGDAEGREVKLLVNHLAVDPDFLTTFGIKLLAGRNFDYNKASDFQSACLINLTTLHQVGWRSPEDALGQHLLGRRDLTIVGVVDDLHFYSLHQPVTPMVMAWTLQYNYLTLSVLPENRSQVLAHIQSLYDRISPEFPPSVILLGEQLRAAYLTELRLGSLLAWFSGLAVFIACLGMLGLASFSAQQRQKEIAVRRILGGSAWGLVAMLSNEFLLLFLGATLLSWPLASYSIARWLAQFPYHVPMAFDLFLLATLGALFLGWVTIAQQSLRVIHANPAKILKYE